MQQLVEVGRNAPCPCGSGRKYKKCCLGFQEQAVAGGAGELDVARLVEEAIELDDWEPIYGPVDRAMMHFKRGELLEHVRLREDLLSSQYPTRTELAKLCTAGWLRRCELELAFVLDRFVLPPDDRDALRLAAHLVRRFGARSPVVEELSILQVEERIERRRRVADALAAASITYSGVTDGVPDLLGWLERARPPVLPFADWLGLHYVPAEDLAGLWASGVSARVYDLCFERLSDISLADRCRWVLLAAVSVMNESGAIGTVLARLTPPRDPTSDEQALHEALLNPRDPHSLRCSILPEIIDAAIDRGDYVGAALLREVLRMFMQPRSRRR